VKWLVLSVEAKVLVTEEASSGVTYVRRDQGSSMPDTAADPPQGTEKPLRQDGNTSGKIHLRKGSNAGQREEKGKNGVRK